MLDVFVHGRGKIRGGGVYVFMIDSLAASMEMYYRRFSRSSYVFFRLAALGRTIGIPRRRESLKGLPGSRNTSHQSGSVGTSFPLLSRSRRTPAAWVGSGRPSSQADANSMVFASQVPAEAVFMIVAWSFSSANTGAKGHVGSSVRLSIASSWSILSKRVVTDFSVAAQGPSMDNATYECASSLIRRSKAVTVLLGNVRSFSILVRNGNSASMSPGNGAQSYRSRVSCRSEATLWRLRRISLRIKAMPLGPVQNIRWMGLGASSASRLAKFLRWLYQGKMHVYQHTTKRSRYRKVLV